MTTPDDPTPDIPGDASVSVRGTGLLGAFNRRGAIDTTDVQVAAALMRIDGAPAHAPSADELVALAAAFCVRGLRHGSVALDLGGLGSTDITDEAGDPVVDLPWPDPAVWLSACAEHPIVATDRHREDDLPLRLHHGRVYLQKYWLRETSIRDQVVARLAHPTPPLDREAVRSMLTKLFPDKEPDLQRLAAATAVAGRFTVLAGGPGTGKTTTIAAILSLLDEACGADLLVALAAPTGKAAARMEAATNDALRTFTGTTGAPAREITAVTLHRLLRPLPHRSQAFRHDRYNPLPHDLVIVDESSMVDLDMMHRLLDAVRSDARVVLVGDPDQLSSIDAGAVLGDLVAVDLPAPAELTKIVADLAPRDPIDKIRGCATVTLQRVHRFGGAIADLAAAVSAGDADRALTLLRAGRGGVSFVEVTGTPTALDTEPLRNDVVAASARVRAAAAEGRAVEALEALDEHRVLCAHREGPFGVAHWNAAIRSWVAPRTMGPDDGQWQVGQGIIVTANDYSLGLYNGDAGVILNGAAGTPAAAFARPGGPLLIPPIRLDAVMSLDAMTIHRGQGSQFATVSVILPGPDSPLLTRELLYTAITRAQKGVRIVGSPESVRSAVDRRVVRASGLRDRLNAALGGAG